MRGYLKGRVLWCGSAIAEILPRDFEDMNMGFFRLAIEILTENESKPILSPVSVKVVAIRCINRYSRKIKKEL